MHIITIKYTSYHVQPCTGTGTGTGTVLVLEVLLHANTTSSTNY